MTDAVQAVERVGRATAGSSTNMNVMRLPSSPAPSARTLTGTIALRSRGRSSRRSAWRRSAPATAASTTSLTVTPWACLIARSSSSGRRAVARWRSGELRPLSALRGATGSTAPASARPVRRPKAGQRQRRARERERVAQQPGLLARAIPGAAGEQLERVRRPAPGSHSGSALVGGGRRLGVEQQRAELDRGEPVDHAVVGLADEPDACRRASSGAIHSSHSGRSRAQRLGEHGVGEVLELLGGRVVDVLGGVEVLGVDPQRRVAGRARRARSAGGSAARGRGGRAMCANSSLEARGAAPCAGGANVAAQPTCMCALGPSTARNEASRAESRSVGIAASTLARALAPDRRRVFTRLSDVARERVAGARVAVVEAALEPARALLRGAVRERLRADPPGRLRPGCGRRPPTPRRSGPPRGRPPRAARARTSSAPTRRRGSPPAARPEPTARCAASGFSRDASSTCCVTPVSVWMWWPYLVGEHVGLGEVAGRVEAAGEARGRSRGRCRSAGRRGQ